MNPLDQESFYYTKKKYPIAKIKRRKGINCRSDIIYWKENNIKCDVATGKGKKLYDQRQDIKKGIGNEIKEEFSKILENNNINV